MAAVAAGTIGAESEARGFPRACGSSPTCDRLKLPQNRLQTFSDADLGEAITNASNQAIGTIARGIKS